jgi:hypothetical protein
MLLPAQQFAAGSDHLLGFGVTQGFPLVHNFAGFAVDSNDPDAHF